MLARHFVCGTLLGYALAAGFTLTPAHGEDMAVGVNVVNPLRASVADQNALIAQLKAAGVRVIRASVTPDDKGIDFAKRVYAAGIKIELGVSAQYPPDAPKRAYQPDTYPNMWSGHPLSYADPELSRAYFQSLIDKLEANGIVLAGFELGNGDQLGSLQSGVSVAPARAKSSTSTIFLTIRKRNRSPKAIFNI